MKPLTCGRCGQEVRYGTRDGVTAWLHREDVDHHTVLGTPWSPEQEAEWDAALDVPRERWVPTETGWPLLFTIETYTTREFDRARMSKAKRDALKAEEIEADPELAVAQIDPVEVWHEPIEKRDTRCPQGVRNVISKAGKHEFEVVRLSYARGPYLGDWPVVQLGVSDTVVLGLEGPVVDSAPEHAVASWRDGKADWAYRIDEKNVPTKISVTELKTWMSRVSCRQTAARIKEALRG